MKILRADFILKCDESFEIIKDGAISFDKKILAVDSFENIKTTANIISIINPLNFLFFL